MLKDILATPVSPSFYRRMKNGEIAQKTEDLVGPYELHDFFLYHMLRFGETPSKIYRLSTIAFDGIYSGDIIMHWLKTFIRRFFLSAVQAFLHTRRSEGRLCNPLPPRRLAYAVRRVSRALAFRA